MKNAHRQVSKLYIFGTVADCGSFSRAADALALGKAVVSQHISDLERELGARLLNRSTRSLTLTAEGAKLLPHAQALISATDAGISAVKFARSELSGHLRLTAARELGLQLLPPLVARFNDLHPAVSIELIFEDAIIDFESERIDVALQMGVKRRQGLVVRKLAVTPHCICANTRTAARYQSAVKRPSDLETCPAVIFTGIPHSDRWTLKQQNYEQRIQLEVHARANSVEAVRKWILLRPMIAILPRLMVEQDLKNGTLQELLPDWELPSVTLALAHRRASDLPARTRAFVDFALADIAEHV